MKLRLNILRKWSPFVNFNERESFVNLIPLWKLDCRKKFFILSIVYKSCLYLDMSVKKKVASLDCRENLLLKLEPNNLQLYSVYVFRLVFSCTLRLTTSKSVNPFFGKAHYMNRKSIVRKLLSLCTYFYVFCWHFHRVFSYQRGQYET